MARNEKPAFSTSVSKIRNRASPSSSSASWGAPFSTLAITSLRMSSRVAATRIPNAVERPTAGSASIARIRASGRLSISSRTNAAEIDVFPTPPFPARAMIFVLMFNCAPVRLFFIIAHAIEKLNKFLYQNDESLKNLEKAVSYGISREYAEAFVSEAAQN